MSAPALDAPATAQPAQTLPEEQQFYLMAALGFMPEDVNPSNPDPLTQARINAFNIAASIVSGTGSLNPVFGAAKGAWTGATDQQSYLNNLNQALISVAPTAQVMMDNGQTKAPIPAAEKPSDPKEAETQAAYPPAHYDSNGALVGSDGKPAGRGKYYVKGNREPVEVMGVDPLLMELSAAQPPVVGFDGMAAPPPSDPARRVDTVTPQDQGTEHTLQALTIDQQLQILEALGLPTDQLLTADQGKDFNTAMEIVKQTGDFQKGLKILGIIKDLSIPGAAKDSMPLSQKLEFLQYPFVMDSLMRIINMAGIMGIEENGKTTPEESKALWLACHINNRADVKAATAAGRAAASQQPANPDPDAEYARQLTCINNELEKIAASREPDTEAEFIAFVLGGLPKERATPVMEKVTALMMAEMKSHSATPPGAASVNNAPPPGTFVSNVTNPASEETWQQAVKKARQNPQQASQAALS